MLELKWARKAPSACSELTFNRTMLELKLLSVTPVKAAESFF